MNKIKLKPETVYRWISLKKISELACGKNVVVKIKDKRIVLRKRK